MLASPEPRSPTHPNAHERQHRPTASWWPHVGMHAVAGMDMDKLVIVDYVFHLPYILSAVVVAYFFYRTLQAASVTRKPVYA